MTVEVAVSLYLLLCLVVIYGPEILIPVITKVGRMSWINWFVKRKPEEEEAPVAPVSQPAQHPKPHKIKVLRVGTSIVCFTVDGGVTKYLDFNRGESPEDAIVAYVQREDDLKARRKSELKRVQEEINKRF